MKATQATAAIKPGAVGEGPHLLPVYPQLAVEPVRGDGLWIETRDGRRLLDFYGGHAVAILGHGHPRVLAALREQAATLFFQSNVVPLAVRQEAAARLVRFAPAGLDQVFFVNSGAEANENALRIACRRTRRSTIVAVEGGFHGRTAAAAAVSDGAAGRWYGFPRTPFDVRIVPRGDLGALAAAIDHDVAAVILEPVQGLAGAIELGGGYLNEVWKLTRERGALLIFDEVQCGMGRTGFPFAAQRYETTPDLLTVAKGLAAGLPAGAVLATRDAALAIGSGDLGTTFGGGPLAAAVILAVIDTIEREDLLRNVRRVGPELRERCRVGPVVDVQGVGFLLGLRTTRPAREVLAALLERGILAGASADPYVLRLLPPLTLGLDAVETLATALAEIPA